VCCGKAREIHCSPSAVEEPVPAPSDLDDFKGICKADQKKRAYCCRIDEVSSERECVVP
jgi:hypothetical protein